MRATSDPILELAICEPRTEKDSSSSAAALTLALSSGRSDSFSSKAKVVPEVILFPSRLGALAPVSDMESALCEASSETCVPASFLCWEAPIDDEPFTTRFGVAGPEERLRSFSFWLILASVCVVCDWFAGAEVGDLMVAVGLTTLTGAGAPFFVAVGTLVEGVRRCSMLGTATRGARLSFAPDAAT